MLFQRAAELQDLTCLRLTYDGHHDALPVMLLDDPLLSQNGEGLAYWGAGDAQPRNQIRL